MTAMLILPLFADEVSITMDGLLVILARVEYQTHEMPKCCVDI
jgi:hypothetical protein